MSLPDDPGRVYFPVFQLPRGERPVRKRAVRVNQLRVTHLLEVLLGQRLHLRSHARIMSQVVRTRFVGVQKVGFWESDHPPLASMLAPEPPPSNGDGRQGGR